MHACTILIVLFSYGLLGTVKGSDNECPPGCLPTSPLMEQGNGEHPNLFAYICIPVSFLLSISGAALPLLDRVFPLLNFTEWTVFRLLIGMAGGIVVSVALTHSFPDGSEDLQYAIQQGTIPDYAWAGLCALLGLFVTLGVEVLISVYLLMSSRIHGTSHQHYHHSEAEKQSVLGQDGPHAAGGRLLCGTGDLLVYLGDSIVLLAGLCFHSFFVGVNQGLQGNDLAFFMAIVAHQFFEGLALGVKNCSVKFPHSLLVILAFDLTFALATPLGIVVGLAIKASIGSGTLFAIVSGASNSLSAGVLLWVGSIHLIHEELGKAQGSSLALMGVYLGVWIGGLAMAAIAIAA